MTGVISTALAAAPVLRQILLSLALLKFRQQSLSVIFVLSYCEEWPAIQSCTAESQEEENQVSCTCIDTESFALAMSSFDVHFFPHDDAVMMLMGCTRAAVMCLFG